MEAAASAEEISIDGALLNGALESTEYCPHSVPWKKQYEIWRHGDELIANAKSRYDFEAGIMQLQRAVEQRDTIVEQLYHCKEIRWFPRPLNQYAVMAELGIIRPSLKDPLRQLRNKIAHGVDDVALDRKQCEYLSDTAWYYLRATDILARQCASELTLQCGENDAHFTLLVFKFRPGSWVLGIRGNVPDRHVLRKGTPDALVVKVTSGKFEQYRGVRHFKFRGSVTGSEAICRRLVQTFFEEAI